MSVIMGTAGHIDHGKTSLIRALTGIDCDRLGEEKRRGITIELGFAYVDLPGGERMGIVDMPGHERFVRTMVAGASGIDFVMLVISADEGVMPQTREHLEICTLLGVRHGIVALTKIDMVDADMLELATEDVREFLKGTFLEGAPIFPVSSVTGEGLDALRAAIAEQSRRQPRRRSDLFRLPVDRVFSLKGHGTVVTGTLVSGSAACGDEVELLPSGRRSHIRSIQSHGEGQEKAEAGHRISLNLHGLSVEDISRGDVVTHVGTMKNSRRWIVELTCLASSPRGLRHRGEIHFHHSARELAARLYFYDRDRLEPGDTALVEVHFSEPVAGVFADRCIVRAFSPLRTVAGGSILYPLDTAPRRSHIDEAMQKRLLSLPDADAETRIAVQLELAGRFGATLSDLSILTDLGGRQLEKQIQAMSGKGGAFCWDKDAKCWISPVWLERLMERALAATEAFHRKNPLEHGMAKGVILAGMGAGVPPKLAHYVLERLLRSGRLMAEGELLRLPEHKVSLADDQQALKEALLKAHLATPLMPPNHTELFAELGISARQAQPIFKILVGEGALVKIKEDLYYLSSVMEELRQKVRDFLASHAEITPGDFRDISGISRKNGIALLEHFDKEQLTMRVGDKRVLRGRSA
ncbi:selenocysteine-specific translation elongation factor [uncultured Mailhella sp.]|uniref:selenocysteine-specific translation elongation factor n=1 Tax=uncultured Mailhella sp. TaxID=1981031 RepID=UPI0025D230EA|nr:selenocysteine-specific translation elongation factor [uncultured Mailhella sp.]